MAEAKQVVKPQDMNKPAAPSAGTTKTPVSSAPVGKWRFVKLHGVAQPVVFADGSSFTFRLIPLNDGSGFANTSELVTSDEKLAGNLREAAKNVYSGVVEVKI